MAKGIPSGSTLEFASNAILSDAIAGRQSIKKSQSGQAMAEFVILASVLIISLLFFYEFNGNSTSFENGLNKYSFAAMDFSELGRIWEDSLKK